MDENDFAVKVTFNGVEYPFAFGSQAYIFHTGVYNNIHKNISFRHNIFSLDIPKNVDIFLHLQYFFLFFNNFFKIT